MKIFPVISGVVLLMICGGAISQPTNPMPIVNGEALSQTLLSQRLAAVLAQGQIDTPQLRDTLLQDLINRQLLLKEAQRQGAEKDVRLLEQIATIREDLLVEWLLLKQSNPTAIEASELKAEYDRQVTLLKTETDLKEYQLHLIMLATKQSASDVIHELNIGASFEKLAREKSIDASNRQGGLVGWILPQLMTPTIAGVMANLPKGATSIAPIETPVGWAVIRVADIRPYTVPTFEESRDRLVSAVVMRKRIELIQGLRQKAIIKP